MLTVVSRRTSETDRSIALVGHYLLDTVSREPQPRICWRRCIVSQLESISKKERVAGDQSSGREFYLSGSICSRGGVVKEARMPGPIVRC